MVETTGGPRVAFLLRGGILVRRGHLKEERGATHGCVSDRLTHGRIQWDVGTCLGRRGGRADLSRVRLQPAGAAGAGAVPQCGEPPSPPVSISLARATAALTLAKTQADRAWLWCVGLGLVVLVVTSISTAHVALVMQAGGASVAAVNLPARRSGWRAWSNAPVGNRPAEWGVSGTLAVLGCLVGVWLVTEPQALRPAGESPVSIRRLARWSAVLLTGGVLGVLLGGYSIPYFGSRNTSRAAGGGRTGGLPANPCFTCTCGNCAAPARPAGGGAFYSGAVLVPVVVAGAAGMLVLSEVWDRAFCGGRGS